MIRMVTKMSQKLLILFLLGATYILCGSSIAESAHVQGHGFRDGDWSFHIGALGIYRPEYEGAHDYEVSGLPIINITWRDRIFFNTRKGLGAYVWNHENVKLGLSVGYTFGRDEDDSSHLDGLGDIDSGANTNILFEWTIEDVALDARYEQQITGEDTGFLVHLGLGYNMQLAKKIRIIPSVKTTYASSYYMKEYFGISQGQSSRSRLSAYDAGSGIKSIGMQIMAHYRVNQKWGVQTMVGYHQLIGDAANSPIVKNEEQYLLGTGLSYEF